MGVITMERNLGFLLRDWLTAKDRKPLIIRGARQVGKTWLVRRFAQQQNKQLIELNFEKKPSAAQLFSSNDPKEILRNIGAANNQVIDPKQSLLFLDEIQAVPILLSKLRWFAEDLSELPVMAAGSLLEFILEQHEFSMPVGRISYAHLEPLSFEEFLAAKNQSILCEYLLDFNFDREIPEMIHQQLSSLFKEYLLIGGLPAAVSSWVEEDSLIKINQIHHDLLTTYRDDFAKYRGRVPLERLDEVLLAVPKMLGQKFVFRHVNSTLPTLAIKKAVDLLQTARICHPVISTAANGVPLAAEANKKFFKEIFVDSGLCCAALGMNFNQLMSTPEITLINHGGLAEQVAGQLLRTVEPFYIEPSLYYWQRDVKGSNAEIDYLLQHGNQVVPIEVKAGKTGTLKSLHLFMELKKFPIAVRVNSALPSKVKIKNFHLLSIPFYLLGQIHRLLAVSHPTIF